MTGVQTCALPISFGAAKGFEYRLGLVMCVLALEVIDMQRHIGMIHKALKELVHQIDIKSTNHCPPELDMEGEPRPAGEVENDP